MVRRLLSLLLPAAALLAAAAAQAHAAPVSSHAMVHTCCTPAAVKDRIFAEAAASGAEFIRVDVELGGIFEGTGSREDPDWRALDEVIELAERHDLRVLGLILGMPSWLSSCPEPPRSPCSAPPVTRPSSAAWRARWPRTRAARSSTGRS